MIVNYLCITYGYSFTTVKDHNSGCHRVWFTVELQANPAPPDYTLTLITPALSSTSAQLKVDSPHFEPLQLEVRLHQANVYIN